MGYLYNFKMSCFSFFFKYKTTLTEYKKFLIKCYKLLIMSWTKVHKNIILMVY